MAKKQKIYGNQYTGLTQQEAQELYELQYQDYLKQVNKAKGAKGAKGATDAATTFGQNYVYPTMKGAASFSPLGPVIGLMDAKQAYDEGKTGSALALAGMEALPYMGRYLGKGLKAGYKGLKNIKKSSVNLGINNLDDLLNASSEEVKNLTGQDKSFWTHIIKKDKVKADKFLQSKLSPLRLDKINKAPTIIDADYTNIVDKAKKKQEDWLKSDEWLKRRMEATGENRSKAIIARSTMLNKLKKTETELKDITNLDSFVQGFANSKQDIPKVTVGIDKNNPKLFSEFANHEYIHASNAWNPGYTMKGIPFKNIKTTSINPQIQKTVKYLNDPVEQQVRGVRALNHLENKGLWKTGNVSDEAIEVLKKRYLFWR